MKERGETIAALGVYDSPMAAWADSIGFEIFVIGNSGPMSLFGHKAATTVTADELLFMTRAVSRVTRYALIVATMPYMSYAASREESVRTAAWLVSEGGAAMNWYSWVCDCRKQIKGSNRPPSGLGAKWMEAMRKNNMVLPAGRSADQHGGARAGAYRGIAVDGVGHPGDQGRRADRLQVSQAGNHRPALGRSGERQGAESLCGAACCSTG